MRIRLLALVLLGSVVTASRADAQFRVPDPAAGEDFHLELGLMFWTPTPQIMIQTGALAALGGSQVDFVDLFAIENKRFNEFRAVLKPGRKHKVRFSYVPMQYTEQAVLQRSISFGGQTFPISVQASSDLDWKLWRFGYEWDFVATDRGVVGLVTELQYNKVRAELSATGVGTSITEVSAPVPTVGLLMRAYPHRLFGLTFEFTGLKLPGFITRKIADTLQENDANLSTFDLDIYGTLNFGSHVAVQGGYRSVSADYLLSDDSGDLTMKGMYFGGLVRF